MRSGTIPHPDGGARRFVVRYRLPLYLACCCWIVGWALLYKLLFDDEAASIPRASPGVWFDKLFWAAIVAVNGLLGPAGVIKYSLSVSLDDRTVMVSKLFGTYKKKYPLSAVEAFEVSSGKKTIPTATMRISGGETVTVSGYAHGFDHFCRVMSALVQQRKQSIVS